MRVLVYSTQRCGSTAVMHWISKELDLTPVFEPFIPCGEEDYRRYNNNWINDLDTFKIHSLESGLFSSPKGGYSASYLWAVGLPYVSSGII